MSWWSSYHGRLIPDRILFHHDLKPREDFEKVIRAVCFVTADIERMLFSNPDCFHLG
jgi:hypothetical protein